MHPVTEQRSDSQQGLRAINNLINFIIEQLF